MRGCLEEIVTDYISIGDYVLTGGELPAVVVVDAVSRMVPGVLSNRESGEIGVLPRTVCWNILSTAGRRIWHDRSGSVDFIVRKSSARWMSGDDSSLSCGPGSAARIC